MAARPTTTSRSFTGAWPASPACSPVSRHAALAHLRDAGLSEEQMGDIALVISEGISNVINHAYVGVEPGEFRLTVELEGDVLRVAIADDGSGMLPRADTPGLGLGLPLIASLAERFDVRTQQSGGTCLTAWFRVRRSGPPEK
jgi:serine/threonine-protein kinase RsbW/stage II sporulation protein AB (anti-sigma F factor)